MTETKENKALIIQGRYDLTVPEHTLIKRGLKLANSLIHRETKSKVTSEFHDKLIRLVEKKGFATYDDINDLLLPDITEITSSDQIDPKLANAWYNLEVAYNDINRHDYAIAPPAPTLCDCVQGAGRRVYGIGKIGDIFSMRGIDEVRKGTDAMLAEHLLTLADEAAEGSLTFANFVEFDTLYGHRRDVSGYARALEWFDGVAGAFLARLRHGDLAIFTADHGNDPTWAGNDHTRERVPVVGWGAGARAVGQVGYADVGASLAAHLGVPFDGSGRSFL